MLAAITNIKAIALAVEVGTLAAFVLIRHSQHQLPTLLLVFFLIRLVLVADLVQSREIFLAAHPL